MTHAQLIIVMAVAAAGVVGCGTSTPEGAGGSGGVQAHGGGGGDGGLGGNHEYQSGWDVTVDLAGSVMLVGEITGDIDFGPVSLPSNAYGVYIVKLPASGEPHG